ncbi:MAG TPA: hypothetical protein VHI78_02405, partial [Bacteroidales bacterium]|nr:hypothetical protein [Bacteroidales bacterium]
MIIRFSMRTLAVILFLLTLFICEGIFAQDDKPIRSYFSEDDLKKLVKAEKYKADADKFSAETNKLNLEIINIQAETGLSEKSIAKKVKDLENKSIQNQIAASELFEKSNEIRFTVYKKNIDDLRKKHSENDSEFIDAKLLEEQAGDNYFQAASYRIEAKKLDGYAKIEKLNEAAILEEQAIQKQLSVLYQYLGISQLVSDGGEVAESTAEITINQEMIDSYNRYMASGQLSDSTLSTGKIAAVTTFDPDRLLNLWYDYMYGLRDSIDSNVRQELTMTSDEVISNSPAEPEENLIGVGETKKEEETSVSNDKAGDVIYRVQIAANRSELSQRTLSKIYYGTKNVEVTNEDGWYKYTVGDFATYDEASDFKKSSG